MSKRKAIPKKTRLRVYEKCNHRCAYCGCELDYKDMQVDHIKSVYVNADLKQIMSEEEMNSYENLLPSCRQCNFYKSSMSLEKFRERLRGTMMDNLRKNFGYRLAIKYGLIEEHNGEPVKFYFEKMNEKLTDEKRGEKILDACCGSRMFWFDRENPDVIFADNREVETTLCDGRTLLIKPDIKMDFRHMPYEDNTFKVVVFDPPHLVHAGTGSWLSQKYGILPKDWKAYLKDGFNECMRVLESDGLLVFKWNEDQIKLNDILKEFGKKPLLGDQRGKTRWILFMK